MFFSHQFSPFIRCIVYRLSYESDHAAFYLFTMDMEHVFQKVSIKAEQSEYDKKVRRPQNAIFRNQKNVRKYSKLICGL